MNHLSYCRCFATLQGIVLTRIWRGHHVCQHLSILFLLYKVLVWDGWVVQVRKNMIVGFSLVVLLWKGGCLLGTNCRDCFLLLIWRIWYGCYGILERVGRLRISSARVIRRESDEAEIWVFWWLVEGMRGLRIYLTIGTWCTAPNMRLSACFDRVMRWFPRRIE